jgi:hypothetical protein
MSSPGFPLSQEFICRVLDGIQNDKSLSGNLALILVYAFKEAYLSNSGDGTFVFGIFKWMRKTGMHDCTLRKHRDDLCSRNYIQLVKPHQGNSGPVYRFNLERFL